MLLMKAIIYNQRYAKTLICNDKKTSYLIRSLFYTYYDLLSFLGGHTKYDIQIIKSITMTIVQI